MRPQSSCMLLLVAHASALVLPHAAAHGPHYALRHTQLVMQEPPLRFEICQNKYCRKKGSKATLALFEEICAGRDDVIVEAADMSHTEHGAIKCMRHNSMDC